MAKEVRKVFIMHSEASVQMRRDKSRGMLDVMEFGYIVSASPLVFEERKHKHFECSVRSNCVGPVALPEREALWQATYLQKKKIYGTAGIIAVGGKDGDDCGDTEAARQKPRNNDTVEPVAFHSESVEYYEDVIDWFRTTGRPKYFQTLILSGTAA